MRLLGTYYAQLEIINGVRFTPREIIIIACILNGRSAKTIPFLLSIAPKTVAAHIENIRSKTGCTSREGIIDFIEKSEQCALIKNEFYVSLLTLNSFEKCLRNFSKALSGEPSAYTLIHEQEDNAKSVVAIHLQQHLTLAGFKITKKIKKGKSFLETSLDKTKINSEEYALFILSNVDQLSKINVKVRENGPPSHETEPFNKRTIILVPNNGHAEGIQKEEENIQCIEFSEKNYYLSFIKMLQILFPHNNVESVFSDFKQHLERDIHVRKNTNILMPQKKNPAEERGSFKKVYSSLNNLFFIQKLLPLSIIGALLLLVVFSYDVFIDKIMLIGNNKNAEKMSSIRSDLIIPTVSSLLNRPELLTQIETKLNGDEGIQTLALIGIGGAGKTTLARQYAQQQKAKVIWEINATTKWDLNTSFEKLATALSETEKQKSSLRVIQEIKNIQEREEQILQFVKKRLQETSPWLLIFDNVGTLAELEKYFPQDVQNWGIGKVILTTQDHNIQNNTQINQTLFIGELSNAEKLTLFIKIISSGLPTSFTDAQKEEAALFLNNIPSFPLDVSVAAYYLWSTHSSYAKYLENIRKYQGSLEDFHQELLESNSYYNKTRYGIITLSLKEILQDSQDFTDLFLLISLINAQRIPRDLLENYKNSIIVDKFIYNLKKFSFIVNNSPFSTPSSSISFHQSIQDVSLPYLVQKLALSKESPLLNSIINILDDYANQAIEEEEVVKIKCMSPHLESLLSHSELLTDLSVSILQSKLGSIYYFTNKEKSYKMLESSLNLLNHQTLTQLSSEDKARVARSFLRIGAIYTELRLYKEAEQILNKAIEIYGEKGLKNYAEVSWVLSHLGNVYRRLGNFERAKAHLEESLRLSKYYGSDQKRIGHTLGYLGDAYGGLGFYPQAIDLLKESLAFYKKNYPSNHFRVGWALMHLGNMYRKVGDYEKSLTHLHQSLEIFKQHFEEDHIRIGWTLFHLAATYNSMGNKSEASILADRVLNIYSKYSGENTIESARILRDMSKIHLEKNNLDYAESLAKQSLNILEAHQHSDANKSLEALGDIYLKKSTSASFLKENQDEQSLRNQAIDTFNQALEIAKKNFPKTSVHIERISSKIKKLQEQR